MAIPQFIAEGGGFNENFAAGTGTMSWPADVSVSDLAVLFLAKRNDTAGTITTGNLFNWTTLAPAQDYNIIESVQLKYRICDGTEDSLNNISIVSTGTTGRRLAQVYTFRGTPSGTWGFDLNNAGAAIYAYQSNATSSSTHPNLGVSVSGTGRLLLNFWLIIAQQIAAFSLSAETGGIWTEAGHYDPGIAPSLGLQICSLTTSGSISNGIGTTSSSSGSAILATGIWVAPGVTELTLSPSGTSEVIGLGRFPIICPSGRGHFSLINIEQMVVEVNGKSQPSAFGAPTVSIVIPGDIFFQPFNKLSPFNRPIGTGANYASAGHVMTTDWNRIGFNQLSSNNSHGFNCYRNVASDGFVTIEFDGSSGGNGNGNLPITVRAPAMRNPDPSGTEADSPTILYDTQGGNDRFLEFARFRGTGSNPWTARDCDIIDPYGDGRDGGASASNIAGMGHTVRNQELISTDPIRGTISISINAETSPAQLDNIFVWPAKKVDSSCGSGYACNGNIPYGQLFALPRAVNISALGLSALGVRLAEQARDYGIYATDNGGQNCRADQFVSAAVRTDFMDSMTIIKPLMRAILNNESTATQPTCSGGGTPIAINPAFDADPPEIAAKPRIGMHQVGMYYGGSTDTGPAIDLTYINGNISRGAINWLSHEQTQGNYTWGNLDTAINNIWNLGNVPTIASIGSAPSWANGGNSDEWTVPWTGSQATWDTFCSRYAAFCGQVAARYTNKLYYEIWNEPGDQYFWRPAPTTNKTLWKSRYAQMFSTASTAILNAYPSAIVMLGGFSGLVNIGTGGISSIECFTAFMDAGLQFQHAGIHPYHEVGSPDIHTQFRSNYDDTVAVYQLFASRPAYANTKLWLTEYGNWSSLDLGQTTQANYIEICVSLVDSGFGGRIPDGIVQGSMYFIDRDHPVFPNTGMFTSSGTPKQSATRVRDYLVSNPRN